jgi:type II secretory pathway pseudopilin PulG
MKVGRSGFFASLKMTGSLTPCPPGEGHGVRARGRRGFTYIGLLISITIIGITMAVVGPSLKTLSRVEKERELLWEGHQFRLAIKRYYMAYEVPSAQAIRTYPSELKDLMQDPRSPGVHRYLRKIYIDPMTGKDDWVPVFDDKQHIKGVHSKSDAETLKRDNFDLADIKFQGKTKYSEWIFEYNPAEDPDAAQALGLQQPQQQQQQQKSGP